jgi:hypothetical protein
MKTGRRFATSAMTVASLILATRTASASEASPPSQTLTCAAYLKLVDNPQAAVFMKSMIDLGGKYKWYGENADTSNMEDRLKATIGYCKEHPRSDLAEAARSIAPPVSQAPSRSLDGSDFEAASDVRAYVLDEAIPSALSDGDGEFDDGPDLLLSWRLAKKADGTISHVPDLLAIIFNDTGEEMPDFGPDLKVLATVSQRRHVHDKPPSGKEDEVAKTGKPAFFIGSRGRDVWEVARHDGVI